MGRIRNLQHMTKEGNLATTAWCCSSCSKFILLPVIGGSVENASILSPCFCFLFFGGFFVCFCQLLHLILLLFCIYSWCHKKYWEKPRSWLSQFYQVRQGHSKPSVQQGSVWLYVCRNLGEANHSTHSHLTTSVLLTETTETQPILSVTSNIASLPKVTPALLLCTTHTIIFIICDSDDFTLLNIILWFPDTLQWNPNFSQWTVQFIRSRSFFPPQTFFLTPLLHILSVLNIMDILLHQGRGLNNIHAWGCGPRKVLSPGDFWSFLGILPHCIQDYVQSSTY